MLILRVQPFSCLLSVFFCGMHCVFVLFLCVKEPKFTVEGEKAWKLVDLQSLCVYFDQELLGDLDGRNILVSLSAAFVVHVHGAGLHRT